MSRTIEIPPPGKKRRALIRMMGKAAWPRDYDPMSYPTDSAMKREMAECEADIEKMLAALEAKQAGGTGS